MDWAYMLKLGTNMWCDVVPPKWANYAADELHYKGFVMAPWRHTVPHFRQSLISAVDVAARVIEKGA